MEDLRQQRAQVISNLGAVRRALQQQGDRETKRRKRQPERTPTWTGSLRDVQLCLCGLSLVRWNCAEAVTVLQHVHTPPNWGHLTTAEQTTVLEDLFLSRDVDLVESWMHEHSQGNYQRMLMLWRSLAEKQVADWVFEVNTTKGVAPSSPTVYRRYLELLRPAPLYVRRALLVRRSLHAQACWAGRWRHRWAATMGRLRLGDVEAADILCQKAFTGPPNSRLSHYLWGSFRGPSGGTLSCLPLCVLSLSGYGNSTFGPAKGTSKCRPSWVYFAAWLAAFGGPSTGPRLLAVGQFPRAAGSRTGKDTGEAQHGRNQCVLGADPCTGIDLKERPTQSVCPATARSEPRATAHLPLLRGLRNRRC